MGGRGGVVSRDHVKKSATSTLPVPLNSRVCSVSNQVTQAMTNMQQSGEGDLATVVEQALDGAGEFPDLAPFGIDSEFVPGSSPYDFLATGIVSHCYAVLSKDG